MQPVRLADSSVEIGVRPWVAMEEGFVACGEIHKAIVEAFREHRITIPVPQREVRVVNAQHESSAVRLRAQSFMAAFAAGVAQSHLYMSGVTDAAGRG